MTKLKPTAKQLTFLDWELGLFLHFGIRTFYEGYQDWDGKEMNPQAFNPTNLDCEQWLKTAAQAGFKYAILTAKHHDGFANWPTAYSEYSVKATPWKDGNGDVVREFVDACAKFKLKVGIYYSPADYSLVKSAWSAQDYDNYFLNQVSELLTDYGEIDVIWFDGCGSEGHDYNWKRIIAEIRRLQPGIRIFNMGEPDIRWIGNEYGVAPLYNWNEVDPIPFSILMEKNEPITSANIWLPGECDCRMRAFNWFYSDGDEDTVKSVEELMGLYYYSVGRGANFLINIGPNRQGLLPEKDALQLIKFGEEIRNRFSQPLATIADFLQQEDRFIFETEQPLQVNHVILKENMSEGQWIQKFGIYLHTQGERICLYQGKTVGHKKICQFPMIKLGNLSGALSIVIEASDGPYQLRDIQLVCVKER